MERNMDKGKELNKGMINRLDVLLKCQIIVTAVTNN